MDQRKHAPEAIVRGNPMGQFQKGQQPRLLGLGERLHAGPAVGATEGRGDGDDNHLDQLVPALRRATWVFQRRKVTPN